MQSDLHLLAFEGVTRTDINVQYAEEQDARCGLFERKLAYTVYKN